MILQGRKGKTKRDCTEWLHIRLQRLPIKEDQVAKPFLCRARGGFNSRSILYRFRGDKNRQYVSDRWINSTRAKLNVNNIENKNDNEQALYT